MSPKRVPGFDTCPVFRNLQQRVGETILPGVEPACPWPYVSVRGRIPERVSHRTPADAALSHRSKRHKPVQICRQALLGTRVLRRGNQQTVLFP